MSQIDFSNMQVYGANYVRGSSSQDGGLLLEFGITGTGNDHQDTKMICAVSMNSVLGGKLLGMLQQLVGGQRIE